MNTTLRFFGSSACIPERGGDSPSLLVNDELLIDTGWTPLQNLEAAGVHPDRIRTLLFTHMHHDHYMGLPQLLFQICMHRPGALGSLTVYGPKADVEATVRRSETFLQTERFFPDAGRTRVVPVTPGESFDSGYYHVDTLASVHPVQGMLLKITDTRTGKVLCVTGDTEYFPEQAEFFRGGDAIVSETAMGTFDGPANRYGHSGAPAAARIADEAGIPLMFCIHLPPQALREATQCAALVRQRGKVEYPEPFRAYVL